MLTGVAVGLLPAVALLLLVRATVDRWPGVHVVAAVACLVWLPLSLVVGISAAGLADTPRGRRVGVGVLVSTPLLVPVAAWALLVLLLA